MQIEKRLEKLGLTLPACPEPIANYLTVVRTQNLLFLAGHGPGLGQKEAKIFKGKLGKELNIEEGYASAQYVALRILSTLKNTLRDLDRVKKIVKVTGFVNSAPGFIDQPKVVNGASDLFVDVFGERGQHARSAIGVAELPGSISVEIEAVVEIFN